MKIVIFPIGSDNEPDMDLEINIDMEYFPMIGDTIVHDGVHWQVTGRYVLSYSRESEFRAARVQYTLMVKEYKGYNEYI